MPDAPPPDEKDAEFLSDEELRALARRHAAHFRKFRETRRRERERRDRERELRTLASRIETMMLRSAPPLDAPRMLVPGSAGVPATSAPRPGRTPEPPESARGRAAGPSLYPAPRPAALAEHRSFEPSPEASPVARFLRKIGAGGLTVSLIFHVGLIVFALFWVVSTYVAPKEKPPEFFATGSGGGRGGDRPSYADVQSSRRSAGKIGSARAERKIVSKVAKTSIALPEMPAPPTRSSLSGAFSSAGTPRGSFGDLSSGGGGGLGGGFGKDTGIGVGDGRNFVGKFKTTQKILGTNVTADKLAVYMDASGSMTEVIPLVRHEILKKFPTADVYEFFGCGMSDLPDETLPPSKSWERERARLLKNFAREKKPSALSAAKKAAKKKSRRSDLGIDSGWTEALSGYGKALMEKNAGKNLFTFDLGKWLDMVISDGGYDAIFVFADFQDYRDEGIPNEAQVRERWISSARLHGQRFYFFTTEMLPQSIFRDLSAFTGGEIAIPKETAKQSRSARETEKFLKKKTVPAAPAATPPELPESEKDGAEDEGALFDEEEDDADDELSFDE